MSSKSVSLVNFQKTLIRLEAQNERYKVVLDVLDKKRRLGDSVSSADWKVAYRCKVSKLSLVLLLYLFGNDDGEVTKFEKKVFKMVLKEEKEHLLKDDLKKVISLNQNIVSHTAVHNFILQEQLSDSVIKEASEHVRKHIMSKDAYARLLDALFE
ncbi:MAG: hypothetical protein JXB08_06270 [Bacilli bacterium]|nr:hypothetical protein [Bacilli bacterium]MBN2877277.1 hypothetical protein [Bacilli bacterium]